MWTISNDKLTSGSNNITFSSDLDMTNVSVFLKANGNNQKIDFTVVNTKTINLNIDIPSNGTYILILKDGRETYKFNLDYKPIEEYKQLNLIITSTYLKGKLTVTLVSATTINKPLKLTITGDITTDLNWDLGKKKMSFTINSLVVKKKLFSVNINNKQYSFLAVDADNFPSALLKTSKGLKLNKIVDEDITVISDGENILIPKKTAEFYIDWNGIKTFDVYCDSYLLFTQSIDRNKFIPTVSLAITPLRLKLNSVSFLDVEVIIKGYGKFIIPAGQSEVAVDINIESGIRFLEIESATNAVISQAESFLKI